MSSTPQTLLPLFRAALSDFASSTHSLRIVRTVTAHGSSSSSPPPPALSAIFILDSSFNPPSRAHLRIASSALSQAHPPGPRRLLLLLATQNADKAPKPAAFEQRLGMMEVFARDVLASLGGGNDNESKSKSKSNVELGPGEAGAADVAVDIGLTKLPYFMDKARSVAEHPAYAPPADAGRSAAGNGHDDNGDGGAGRTPVEQIHLVGFDTLVRILDTKYYPPDHTLAPLEELFRYHRLRVTVRPDDVWGGRAEQDEYLARLGRGDRESEGGRRGWAERIELVEGRAEGEGPISSTKAREAAAAGDKGALKELCTEGVVGWVTSEGLYRDGEA